MFRLYSYSVPKLPKDFKSFPMKPEPNRIDELAKHKEKKMLEMRQKYPHILERHFNGKMAYTLQYTSPYEMVKKGGLLSQHHPLWLSNTRSGNNQGCICLSLLPDVTSIFYCGNKTPPTPKQYQTPYIYAFPLLGHFFLPGSKWREVISAGAFPLPRFWLARAVLDIGYDNKVKLGPLIGHIGKMDVIPGERYQEYIENQLVKPSEIDFGEDFPLDFEIRDTDESAKFQNEVKYHYENKSKEANEMRASIAFR